MYSLEEELDAFVRRIANPCGGACGCAQCQGKEAARRRAPRAARRQTSPRAVGSQLPGWRGWTPPVRLSEIMQARTTAARGGPVPAHLRPFVAGGPQVYRLTRAGIDRNRPLNIGMTGNTNSIADRITQHHRQPSRADPQVHAAIRNLQPGQILVQAARLAGRLHPRRASNYEGWLQDRERPLLYNPDTTTFESGDTRRIR
jgi:hypothetical protein